MDTPGIILDGEKYWTRADLMRELDIRTHTVTRYLKSGLLPKPTDSGLFKVSDVWERYTRVS